MANDCSSEHSDDSAFTIAVKQTAAAGQTALKEKEAKTTDVNSMDGVTVGEAVAVEKVTDGALGEAAPNAKATEKWSRL